MKLDELISKRSYHSRMMNLYGAYRDSDSKAKYNQHCSQWLKCYTEIKDKTFSRI